MRVATPATDTVPVPSAATSTSIRGQLDTAVFVMLSPPTDEVVFSLSKELRAASRAAPDVRSARGRKAAGLGSDLAVGVDCLTQPLTSDQQPA